MGFGVLVRVGDLLLRARGGDAVKQHHKKQHDLLDAWALTPPSAARTHAPDCPAVYDPYAACLPGCETDDQLRKRLQGEHSE